MELRTERLTLRPLGTNDLLTTHRYASNSLNTRFMLFLPNESIEDTMSFLRSAEEEWQKDSPESYEFAVLLDGTHIGAVGASLDQSRTEANLGWILDLDYWGHGYTYEAAKALLAFLIDIGVTRFEAQCDSENHASARVMEKLGMRQISCTPGRKNRSSDEERFELLYRLER